MSQDGKFRSVCLLAEPIPRIISVQWNLYKATTESSGLSREVV